MSVSLWAWTEQCEGRPCPGDCDNCPLVDWIAELEEPSDNIEEDEG